MQGACNSSSKVREVLLELDQGVQNGAIRKFCPSPDLHFLYAGFKFKLALLMWLPLAPQHLTALLEQKTGAELLRAQFDHISSEQGLCWEDENPC